jgi:hypothetical protein
MGIVTDSSLLAQINFPLPVFKKARNTPFCPSQDVLRGVRNISEAL